MGTRIPPVLFPIWVGGRGCMQSDDVHVDKKGLSVCIKEPYESISEARHTAKGFSREKKQTMEPYLCTNCGKYHLRTVGKRVKLRRDNNKYPFRYQPRKDQKKKKK
jgi:hypothetical protein